MTKYVDKNLLQEYVISRIYQKDANNMIYETKKIEDFPDADVVSGRDFRDCRNELCLRCGSYKTKHLGSCRDCRWEH